MAVTYDLATLVGHLEPFRHVASAIIYETESSGDTISVQEIIDTLLLGLGADGFPSTATIECDLGLVVGQVVYIDSFGVLQAALADDISTGRVIGVMWDQDDSFGTPCGIKAVGPVAAYAGLTVGTEYFLSDSVAGGLTSTPPTGTGHVVQKIGTAIESDTLFVNVNTAPTIRS